jgi:hypothetical protein
MKVKTAEATPLQLNWLVAKCEGMYYGDSGGSHIAVYRDGVVVMSAEVWRPSANWSQGGPIIEREGISPAQRAGFRDGGAEASYRYRMESEVFRQTGPTYLIAAMRCYVASKLGDEVDVPKELI